MPGGRFRFLFLLLLTERDKPEDLDGCRISFASVNATIPIAFGCLHGI